VTSFFVFNAADLGRSAGAGVAPGAFFSATTCVGAPFLASSPPSSGASFSSSVGLAGSGVVAAGPPAAGVAGFIGSPSLNCPVRPATLDMWQVALAGSRSQALTAGTDCSQVLNIYTYIVDGARCLECCIRIAIKSKCIRTSIRHGHKICPV